MTTSEETLHNPTLRVLDALDVISQHVDGCTLTDIAAKIDVPKSTLVPILKTMEHRSFISMDARTGRYSIGIRALAVGSTFSERESLISLVRDEMKKLVDVCSETCQLGVLENGDVFYIAKVDSPEPIRMISSVGKYIPAYCTALGKALLSDHKPNELRTQYPAFFEKLTPATIETVDALISEIEEQREGGMFYEREESTVGLMCFAVPLRRYSKLAAAISVSVPLFRLDKQKRETVMSELVSCQKRIERLFEAYPSENELFML